MPFLWDKLCSTPQALIMRHTLAGWYKSLPPDASRARHRHFRRPMARSTTERARPWTSLYRCSSALCAFKTGVRSQRLRGYPLSPAMQKIISYVKNHNVTFLFKKNSPRSQPSRPAPACSLFPTLLCVRINESCVAPGQRATMFVKFIWASHTT